MRVIRNVIKWSLVGVLLVLPESGFTRIHQSPVMESQGVCLQCEQLTLFQGLQLQTEELLHPVQHGPRVYRAPAPPKRHVKVKPKVRVRVAPKRSPKPTVFRGSQLRTSYQSPSGSAFMKAIARAARSGAGRSKAFFCYTGVKGILRAAGLKGWLPGGSAIDALHDLPRAGFHNDMGACHSEGTVHVYAGPATGLNNADAVRKMHSLGYRYRPGDNHGHIEVVGGDGKFYYNSTGKTQSLDRIMGSNLRHLVGCFVK